MGRDSGLLTVINPPKSYLALLEIMMVFVSILADGSYDRRVGCTFWLIILFLVVYWFE